MQHKLATKVNLYIRVPLIRRLQTKGVSMLTGVRSAESLSLVGDKVARVFCVGGCVKPHGIKGLRRKVVVLDLLFKLA